MQSLFYKLLKSIMYFKPILPAVFIFLVLLIPFFGLMPYLDGDTEFRIAVNFFQGKYLSHWMPYHPPLKLFLTSIIFQLFGYYAYSLLGLIIGIIGIAALYQIVKTLFDKKTAIVATIFLSISGIYISTAIFSVNDFLLTVLILLSFAFYVNKKYAWAIAFSCLAVMSKESAIFFPLSIILVEGFQKKFKWYSILPFVVLLIWIAFLHLTGHALWNSWNFGEDSENGSFFTLIDNIVDLQLFNIYAYENWLHLLVFNYNWIIWIFALGYFLWKSTWNKYFSVIAIFSFFYTLFILSFPTFSITRYILPILPFLYMFAAAFVYKTKYTVSLLPVILICLLLSLFMSVDPLSDRIWRKEQVLNQNFYLNRKIDGNDGITYNMQFLYATKTRDSFIRKGTCKDDLISLNISYDTLQTLDVPDCRN